MSDPSASPPSKTIFIGSLVPIDDPTAGGGVMHREWAKVFAELGYDVVVIEVNNHPNVMADAVPYTIHSIVFDGTRNNPDMAGERRDRYEQARPVVDFNFPVFTGYPASAEQFVALTDAQLGRYLMSCAWAFRSLSLIFGQPAASWNGHTWVQNTFSASAPTLFTVHGTAIAWDKGYRETRLRPLVGLGVDRAFFAAAISEQERKNITDPQRYGMDPARVSVIWNGYNADAFRTDITTTKADLVQRYAAKLAGIDPERPWIVFVGKAAFFKGVDNLIRAFTEVRARTNAQLVIVGGGAHDRVDRGNGTFVDHLDMVRRRGLEADIAFVGPLPQPQMAEFIHVADAYVLPSRFEPFGLVAIEGMATGKAPILSNNGGFVDIVAGRTDIARLFEADDPDSEAARLAACQLLRANQDLPDEVKSAAEALLLAGDHGGPEVDARVAEVATDHRRRAARAITVRSLTDAILAELALPPADRRRRGAAAAAFAVGNFTNAGMVRNKMVPHLERAIAEGRRAPDTLDLALPQPPARQERLDAIGTDAEVAPAFLGLREAVEGGRCEEIAAAWRTFDRSVARYFGHHDLLHPITLDALPPQHDDPSAILAEVARAAGVSDAELRATLRGVQQRGPALRAILYGA